MKIAVTYDNGTVFGHFGHTEKFKLYEVEDGKIVSTKVVDTNGSGHGALAGFLGGLGVDVLICGGIGGGAQIAVAEEGIELRGGVQGSCDEAVEAYLYGKLAYDPHAKCSHHHGDGHDCGHHHGEDHDCGHHHHGEDHDCGHHHHHGEDHDCGHHHGDGHSCHCHDH